MNYIGYIDMINNAYLNIIKSDSPNRFCYTEYITSDRPKILVKEIWHPYLDNNSVIKNNITINKNAKKIINKRL